MRAVTTGGQKSKDCAKWYVPSPSRRLEYGRGPLVIRAKGVPVLLARSRVGDVPNTLREEWDVKKCSAAFYQIPEELFQELEELDRDILQAIRDLKTARKNPNQVQPTNYDQEWPFYARQAIDHWLYTLDFEEVRAATRNMKSLSAFESVSDLAMLSILRLRREGKHIDEGVEKQTCPERKKEGKAVADTLYANTDELRTFLANLNPL